MSLRVSSDDLGLLAVVEKEWGLPTPQNPREREIVGPYHADGARGYLLYEPDNGSWGAFTANDGRRDWPSAELINFLDGSYPTSLPTDLDREARDPSFTYEGYRFAWVFIPVLKRWELAPLGRA